CLCGATNFVVSAAGENHWWRKRGRRSVMGGAFWPVIVQFKSQPPVSIDRLVEFVAADMEQVNRTILSRTSSDVTMIPEVANHLISSGGKRLRPRLTLAMAQLAGYAGHGLRGCAPALPLPP